MPKGPTASTLRASYMPGIMLFDLHTPSHLVPASSPGSRDSSKPHLEMGKLRLADVKGWALGHTCPGGEEAGLWTTEPVWARRHLLSPITWPCSLKPATPSRVVPGEEMGGR